MEDELEIKVLSSGSKRGNCTLIKPLNILFDVGISYKRLSELTDYAYISRAYITHEHKDHANVHAIKELLERGTTVYMTRGTKDALGLENRYNLEVVEYGLNPTICVGIDRIKITCSALSVWHDAAAPTAYCLEIDDETIYYVTDTDDIDFSLDGATRLILEANHSAARLAASKMAEYRKIRIRQNHLSIEKLIKRLKVTDLSKCREIHLIHLSEENGDGAEFAREVKAVVGDISVYIEE